MSNASYSLPELPIDESRARLLRCIGDAEDITFVRGYGNIGDDLIYAGTRQLLSAAHYREVSVRHLEGVGGDVALLAGSGAWCHAYHAMPAYLRAVESRFERVIVLPSSFDISVKEVRETLANTRAKVFAREFVSYCQIRDLCDADLAHDTALYFDFVSYRRKGRGVLIAYRDDPEAARQRLPQGNNDIAMTCESLDEFLWTIARHERVVTDRAHVTIAAALLGKHVKYSASNYHKVPAIAEFSLRGLPVDRDEQPADVEAAQEFKQPGAFVDSPRIVRETQRQAHVAWLEKLGQAREEITCIVPAGAHFIFVDNNEWGREPLAQSRRAVPFLEMDGYYWGAPPDDDTAIAELQRLRAAGAQFMIFAWPAFWFLKHYEAFAAHLQKHFRQIWTSERLIAFDLRAASTNNGPDG